MAVGCFLFSLVLFLLAGLYYLYALRTLKLVNRKLRVLRGVKYERPAMRMRGLPKKERQESNVRFRNIHPKAPNAKAQGFGQKRKKAITKIYGGR